MGFGRVGWCDADSLGLGSLHVRGQSLSPSIPSRVASVWSRGSGRLSSGLESMALHLPVSPYDCERARLRGGSTEELSRSSNAGGAPMGSSTVVPVAAASMSISAASEPDMSPRSWTPAVGDILELSSLKMPREVVLPGSGGGLSLGFSSINNTSMPVCLDGFSTLPPGPADYYRLGVIILRLLRTPLTRPRETGLCGVNLPGYTDGPLTLWLRH